MATAGKILMFPVGNWTSGNNYGFLDIAYYGGSSYISKTDITNSTVNPASDTTNWQILAHGYIADTLSGIDGTDTSGLLGTAGATVSSQTLMDKIADMVADKLVLKTAISNQQANDPTKVTGLALSYAMNQSITEINSNLSNYILTQNVDISYSVTASNYVVLDYTPPSVPGYSAAFVIPTWTGDNSVVFIVAALTGLRMRNLSTAAVSNANARITIVYKKNITV